jgi:NitT/TauT family transport system substrate-binding protein
VERAAPRRIGSIEVGFRLVRVLEAADGPLSLKELSERAGMPPSKSYAYVASFVHEGLIAQDSVTGRYGLGPFAMSIGVAALRQSDFVEVARRDAAALSEATTCSVLITTWGNRGPAIVYRVDGKRRGPTSVRVGYVLPIWRSASGRVFLAYLPESETAALLAAEEGDRLDPASVAQELARIRAIGFALTGDESEFSGIAAPILDHDGHIVAALTLSRPYDENSHDRRTEIGAITRAAAAAMSKQLGHLPPCRREGSVPRAGKKKYCKPDLTVVNFFDSAAHGAGGFVKRSALLRAVAASLGSALLIAGLVPAPTRAADLTTIRVGRAIVNAWPFAVFEVGQDAHIWEKVGLKLDIASFKGDGQLQQAMTAGSIDFGLGSGPAMGYRAKGVPAIAVAALYTAPGDMAIVIPTNSTIKSVKDLKGKTLGVTTAGSLTDWLVHELSRQQGWGSDGITSLAMGSTEARVAAMESGQIAGSVGDIGVAYELQEQGKGRLFQTFAGFVKQFETHVIFASDDMVNKHPEIVEKFLKGWFMTVAYMRTHKPETIKSTKAVLQESDAVLAKLYENDMAGMSTSGAFDPASVAAVAKSLKALGIMETDPDPKTLYTSKFVPVKI